MEVSEGNGISFTVHANRRVSYYHQLLNALRVTIELAQLFRNILLYLGTSSSWYFGQICYTCDQFFIYKLNNSHFYLAIIALKMNTHYYYYFFQWCDGGGGHLNKNIIAIFYIKKKKN